MKQTPHIIQTGTRAQRGVFAYVIVALFALQMVLPAIACASVQQGNWIVICAENGPESVQVDSMGQPISAPQDQQTPCANCDTCPDCNFVTASFVQPFDQINSKFVMQTAQAAALQIDPINNPAQFWGQTRGPPIGNPTAMNRELTVFAHLIQAGVL